MTLPPEPWPVRIAGVPCFLKLENDPYPYDFDEGKCGLDRSNALTDIRIQDLMTGSETQKVLAYFRGTFGENLISVRYCFDHFQIILKSIDGYQTWPNRVAGLLTFYSDSDVLQPYQRAETAKRATKEGQRNMEEYPDNLRPSLMLTGVNRRGDIEPALKRYTPLEMENAVVGRCSGDLVAYDYMLTEDDERTSIGTAQRDHWVMHKWLWCGQW